MIKFQPGPVVDGFADDGTELTKLPYPIYAERGGVIHGWRVNTAPYPPKIIGFVADPSRQEVDLWWEHITDLQKTVGMYLVTSTNGEWSTNVIAIQSVVDTDE